MSGNHGHDFQPWVNHVVRCENAGCNVFAWDDFSAWWLGKSAPKTAERNVSQPVPQCRGAAASGDTE